MIESSGLGVVFQGILICLIIIEGSSSATIHDQQECHNTDVILNCPDFTQYKRGKLSWRYYDKNASQWLEIASIIAGNLKLTSAATSLNGRLNIYPNGSLEISSLEPDDETRYQCIVKQGPRKLHVFKLNVACGRVTKIEREVCVEEDVVLECEAKHRTNPRKLKQIKWQQKGKVSEDTTWLLLVPASNESSANISGRFSLLGNGSLILLRGREEGEDTYRCDATKKGNGRLDRHIIVVKNVNCRKEKQQKGNTTTTTTTLIKGTEVPMVTSASPSTKQINIASTAAMDLMTSSSNIKTAKGRAAMITAVPIQSTEVAMEKSTLTPVRQTLAKATSVDSMTATATASSTTSQSESLTRHDAPTTQSTIVCGGVQRDPIGGFQSPDFPNTYPANSHCKWTITVPQAYAGIVITFDHLHLEHDDNCGSDYVAIQDKLRNQVGCRHCGVYNSPVEKIHVRGRVAVVVFRSDSSVQKTGFRLSYKGVKTAADPDS